MSEKLLTLDELRAAIEPLARRYGIRRVVLFGSYARGDATGKSDIDLLVFGGDTFRAAMIYAMAEDLRCALQKNVDIYEIRELIPDTPFHRTVMEEGVVVA